MAAVATIARVPFKVDDIWNCPDDGKRSEVIEGERYVATAPDLDHQHPCTGLTACI